MVDSMKEKAKWLTSLIAINLIGLLLITLYSAYYSFGTMIFGVHKADAIIDFWHSEMLLGIPFLIGFNLLAIITAIYRKIKNGKK